MTTTQDRVMDVIGRRLCMRGVALKPDDTFVGDYGCDSLDYVELVMAIEDEFGIEIREAEAEQVLTVADAIALVEKTIKEQSNG